MVPFCRFSFRTSSGKTCPSTVTAPSFVSPAIATFLTPCAESGQSWSVKARARIEALEKRFPEAEAGDFIICEGFVCAHCSPCDAILSQACRGGEETATAPFASPALVTPGAKAKARHHAEGKIWQSCEACEWGCARRRQPRHVATACAGAAAGRRAAAPSGNVGQGSLPAPVPCLACTVAYPLQQVQQRQMNALHHSIIRMFTNEMHLPERPCRRTPASKRRQCPSQTRSACGTTATAAHPPAVSASDPYTPVSRVSARALTRMGGNRSVSVSTGASVGGASASSSLLPECDELLRRRRRQDCAGVPLPATAPAPASAAAVAFTAEAVAAGPASPSDSVLSARSCGARARVQELAACCS